MVRQLGKVNLARVLVAVPVAMQVVAAGGVAVSCLIKTVFLVLVVLAAAAAAPMAAATAQAVAEVLEYLDKRATVPAASETLQQMVEEELATQLVAEMAEMAACLL